MVDGMMRDKLNKENYSEVVIAYVKEKIITGKYAEGAHILETELARELGISRAPVREGIRELQNEGIIELIPRKGNYVVTFTAKEKKEILDVRLTLEEEMLAILIRENKLAESDYMRLMEIIDEMVKMVQDESDMKQKAIIMSKKDIEFHKYLWKKSESNIRSGILEKLHFQLQMAMIFDNEMSADLEMSAKEHYDIIECMKRRDLEDCKKALRKHVILCRRSKA